MKCRKVFYQIALQIYSALSFSNYHCPKCHFLGREISCFNTVPFPITGYKPDQLGSIHSCVGNSDPTEKHQRYWTWTHSFSASSTSLWTVDNIDSNLQLCSMCFFHYFTIEAKCFPHSSIFINVRLWLMQNPHLHP